jgi:hypothetical protein
MQNARAADSARGTIDGTSERTMAVTDGILDTTTIMTIPRLRLRIANESPLRPSHDYVL